MDNDFIEFQDFVEDFFNLELEFEIDEEFENAEEIILEEIDESEIVDESLFSFQEIHENNPVLESLYERSFPLKVQELKNNLIQKKVAYIIAAFGAACMHFMCNFLD